MLPSKVINKCAYLGLIAKKKKKHVIFFNIDFIIDFKNIRNKIIKNKILDIIVKSFINNKYKIEKIKNK